MKKSLLITLTLILTVAIGAKVTNAIGSLIPSGTAGGATQYTLNDIYTKLTTNTSTSTKSGMFTTPGSVTATFHTLTEIYNAIPTIDATKVATGTSYLGVTGTLATTTPELEWSTDQGLLFWPAAVSTCAALNESGHTDWRLPTYHEFASMTDITLARPASDISGFEDTEYYWSNTDYADYTPYAWIWFSYDGSFDYEDKPTSANHVRCVR